MKRAWLVFNPVCGKRDDGDRAVVQACLRERFDVVVCDTTPGVDADVWARRALEAGADLVVAAGGDGTVSAVADVLLGTGVPLGVVPRGTANALSAALGLPGDVAAACAAIADERVVAIDAAKVNGRGMVLFAGCGFHADTIERTTRAAKSRLGYLAYLVSGLQELSQFAPFKVSLETEERVVECEAIAVTVANVAPATTILAHGPDRLVGDDGLLDITIVAANGVLEALATGTHLLFSAGAERPATRDNVGWLRARRVRVVADPPRTLMVDGEVRGTTPFTVECLPRALTLLVPRDWDARAVDAASLAPA